MNGIKKIKPNYSFPHKAINFYNKMIKVVYFQRKQRTLGNFSVEIYFEQVRKILPQGINPILVEMPFLSNGFFKRLANAIYCIFKQGDVNHITGDIHYAAIFLKKSKTILTILDCGIIHDSIGIKKAVYKLLWFNFPILRSKIITAISYATKYDIIKITNCNSDKIRVIYFSSNSKFKKNEKVFNKTNPIILQIGTAPNKNIEMLIKSIEGINCHLNIIGKVSEDLKILLKEKDIQNTIYDFRLTDEEIEQMYVNCDIVSFVSTLEGFGMPIIEANTIGRIIVTSNLSSMPEVGGDAAIFVDPYSVESIRKGILTAIENDDLRNEKIQNGYSNCNRFTPKNIANEYTELYKNI